MAIADFFHIVHSLQLTATKPLQFAAAHSTTVNLNDIDKITATADAVCIHINFMQLYGVSGIMPNNDFEKFHESAQQRAPAFAQFTQLFQNHLTHLLVNAWQCNQPTLQINRLKRTLTECFDLKDNNLVPYVNYILRRPISTSALQQLLSSHLSLPVRISENSGKWLEINQAEYTLLGKSFNKLGATSMLGKRFFSPSAAVGIAIGPLDYANYCQLIKGKQQRAAIEKMLAAVMDACVTAQIALQLPTAARPPLLLSKNSQLQLGFHLWF